MTAVEWKESMAVSLATLGQSYNYVSRFTSTGRIVSIQPVHKSRCRPEVRMDGSVVYHYTTLQGRQISLARADVCPIRGFGNVGEASARMFADAGAKIIMSAFFAARNARNSSRFNHRLPS